MLPSDIRNKAVLLFYRYPPYRACLLYTSTEAIDKERIALLDSFGYASDIVAHGVGGSIVTDDIGEAIASDPNFAKIKGPADTNSRYYAEDIPYGLAPWAKLARAMNVDVPVIESMITIGSALLGYDCWEKGHSLQAVSYTHLDVYKRQEQRPEEPGKRTAYTYI